MSRINYKKLSAEMESGSLLTRKTGTQFHITGAYLEDKEERMTLIKQRNGNLKVKWSGQIRVDAAETLKCDMGHEHHVTKDKHWTWNYCEMSKSDISELVAFLTGRGPVRTFND